MKKLIEVNSTLYLKRLVRELNQKGNEDGFYAPVATFVLRCSKARLKDGVLQCHSFAASPYWFVPSSHNFKDVYSRDICASRCER